MRVYQLTDLHLGPIDHDDDFRRRANAIAWDHAGRARELLRRQPGIDDSVVVVTGDLTDEGFLYENEFPPVVEFVQSLPGRVLVVPGNHDVGQYRSHPRAFPHVADDRLARWDRHFDTDRFSHAADGHRLLGVNAMLWGSGLDREADQYRWLETQLGEAAAAGEAVWLFQHCPLFLRDPNEERTNRELYWCPPPEARDRVLELLSSADVRGVISGHVHRRRDEPHLGRSHVWCPALSGTRSDADYFPTDADDRVHAIPMWDLNGPQVATAWLETGIDTRTRLVG